MISSSSSTSGAGHQRAGDGDALLLAARELLGVGLREAVHGESGRALAAALLGLGAGCAMHLARGERDVVQHGHVRGRGCRTERRCPRGVAARSCRSARMRVHRTGTPSSRSCRSRVPPAVDAAQERGFAGPPGRRSGQTTSCGLTVRLTRSSNPSLSPKYLVTLRRSRCAVSSMRPSAGGARRRGGVEG